MVFNKKCDVQQIPINILAGDVVKHLQQQQRKQHKGAGKVLLVQQQTKATMQGEVRWNDNNDTLEKVSTITNSRALHLTKTTKMETKMEQQHNAETEHQNAGMEQQNEVAAAASNGSNNVGTAAARAAKTKVMNTTLDHDARQFYSNKHK
eukprot:jgi/Psemu1/14972/gm1.14972_g